jgi:hypothetical protein
MCDIRLHPSTVASAFEEATAGDVMPLAGDPLQSPATLFVRSLYGAADKTFPPIVTRCWGHRSLAGGPSRRA